MKSASAHLISQNSNPRGYCCASNLDKGDMLQTTEKQRILVVSHDPHLSNVRKVILEAAGFEVSSASNLKAVSEACEKNPDL